MFPTFVWKAELEPNVRDALRLGFEGWLKRAMGSISIERGQSWQSDHDIHRSETFGDLALAIGAVARKILAFLKIANAELVITGCWANVNGPGAGHPRHSHPNNFLSGAYYLEVPPGADTINFHDPRLQTYVLRPPVTELTRENADQTVVQVESGTLLLFPSWLEHSVHPNPIDQARISMSFNLMFARYAETLSPPLWEGGKRTS
jgi:uncharacterized protein (TIGR02466 family)